MKTDTQNLAEFLRLLVNLIQDNNSNVKELRETLDEVKSLLEDVLNELKSTGRNVSDIESAVKGIRGQM